MNSALGLVCKIQSKKEKAYVMNMYMYIHVMNLKIEFAITAVKLLQLPQLGWILFLRNVKFLVVSLNGYSRHRWCAVHM